MIAVHLAYDIRLYAVREYGRIIHEFDPWFNFRATQYLADNGWAKFSKWFDYVMQTLGRPVGTTIYPGMQVTAVAIWKSLGALGEGWRMGLNDVCVFFPAWFGGVATCLVAFLTAECSGSATSAVIAALVMAIVPAHTMRSNAGGFDNESLAVTAMCLTFFIWCSALQTRESWWIGAVAGLAYVYMVAAWGGYTFVLNMVGFARRVIVPVGFFQLQKRAQSLLPLSGSSALSALQFPVAGLAPIKSMEQLGPAGVFLELQVLEFSERAVRRAGLSGRDAWRVRVRHYSIAAVALIAVVVTLAPTVGSVLCPCACAGSSSNTPRRVTHWWTRWRSISPGSADAYFRYLHTPFYIAPAGFAVAVGHYVSERSPAALFLPLYAVVAYYFANRMVRLIIFLGPIASCLTGIAVGYVVDDALANIGWFLSNLKDGNDDSRDGEDDADAKTPASKARSKANAKRRGGSENLRRRGRGFRSKTASVSPS